MIEKLNSKLIRYIIVGGTAYLVEMATLFGLKDGAKFSSVKSVAISFWVGLVVGFLLQKIVTFKDHDRRVHILAKQILMYACLVLFNYVVSLIAVKLLTPKLSVFLVRTMIIALGTFWNYSFYHLLFQQTDVK
ncbi:MAG TPA: GtrA family protein [Candidatus Saccharimonadales bacterium]